MFAYLGRVDGRAVATGMLFDVRPVAGLGNGSVLPRFRGRGIQSAMIAHRMRQALQYQRLAGGVLCLQHGRTERQAGLMCGIELVADRSTKESFAPGDRRGYHICLALRDHGIFLRPLGDVIVLMPPLSSSDIELQHLAASVHAVIVEQLGA